MKKLLFFFMFFCFATVGATAAPVIENGVLISWTDASGYIEIPDEITAIGDNVFKDKYITSISGGTNVVSIGEYSFYKTKIPVAFFPKVKSIGKYAFAGNFELQILSFPVATTIGDGAFSGCEFIKTVNMPCITTIGTSAFSSACSYYSISLSFPEAVSIGNYAFKSCSKLTSISIPKVTTLGIYAFESCYDLKYIELPKVINLNKDYTFKGCWRLETIKLPVVQIIGPGTFESCLALKTIDCSSASELTYVDPSAFPVGNSSSFTVLVSDESKKALFPEVRDYQVIAATYTVDLTKFPLTGGTISGEGVFAYNNSVTVNAVPATGYHFANWTDAASKVVSTDASYTFTVTQGMKLTANFEKNMYTVVFEQPINGTLQLVYENKLINSGSSISYQGEVYVFATPAEGYRFSEMMVNSTSQTKPLAHVIIEGNTSVLASFVKIPPADFTLKINTDEHGKVEVYNLNNNLIPDGTSLTDGSQLKIKAIPNNGYELDYYTIDNKMNINAMFKVVTAVSALEASAMMSIYPNPGVNQINVELSDELRAKQLVITDMSGKTVMIEPVTQQKMKLDISKLAAGMYLIKAVDLSRQLIIGR